MVDTFDASEPRTSRIFSLKDEEDGFVLKEDQEQIIIDEYDRGKLIGVVSACSPDFGKSTGSIARITTESITVYDKQLRFKIAILKTTIVEMLQIDDCYMYCIQRASEEKFLIKRKDKEVIQAVGIFPR